MADIRILLTDKTIAQLNAASEVRERDEIPVLAYNSFAPTPAEYVH